VALAASWSARSGLTPSVRAISDRPIKSHGSSTVQVRHAPALEALRQHRLALGRLPAQLALPEVDETTLRTAGEAPPQRAPIIAGAHHARKAAA
jgi:hypothetical protein